MVSEAQSSVEEEEEVRTWVVETAVEAPAEVVMVVAARAQVVMVVAARAEVVEVVLQMPLWRQ